MLVCGDDLWWGLIQKGLKFVHSGSIVQATISDGCPCWSLGGSFAGRVQMLSDYGEKVLFVHVGN
jgi:hypothetical protein